MRTAKIVLLTLCGAVALTSLAVWLLLKGGLSARQEPSLFEVRLARLARRVATPAATRAMQNPYSPTEQWMSNTKRHFAEHCAACHAPDGSGNTIFGRNMYPRVPDLRKPETQSLADGDLHYIISEGVRFTGMPGFGGEEDAAEIWELVLFLRRLPHLTEEELRELERMAGGDLDGGSEDAMEVPHPHGSSP